MMTLLRKHRSWLMIVIAVLAIPFVFYFNKTDLNARGKDTFATAYGRPVTMIEAQRNARLLGLAENLGMDTLSQTLSGGAEDQGKAAAYFALNLVVLQHEAEELGITATQKELADFIRNLRGFRGPNGFDPKKYQEFSENVLPSNGFSDAQIEELATYALALNRIKDLVTSGLSLPDAESKETFEKANGKLFVHAVRIRASDFAKDVKVSDEDIQKYFETHKTDLKTDEKRKIQWVKLVLTDDQKKLAGKERVEALQKLDDRAVEMTQALTDKSANFEQVAAKLQLPVKTTAEFTTAAPDPQLKDAPPQVAATAFQLTQQEPNSDPIESPDGYFILHLASVVESKPLTIEEAKPKIVDSIKSTRTRELAGTKGHEISQNLREALKSGTTFSAALEKAKVKSEAIPPFSLMEAFDPATAEKDKDGPKDSIMIKNAASQVQPGEVSPLFPTEDGGLFVYLEKREAPDPAKYQKEKADFDERILKNKRMIVFSEWLHDRQRDAGLISAAPPQTPQGAQPSGPAPQAPPPAAPPRKS